MAARTRARTARLPPLSVTQPRLEYRSIHGYRRAFRIAGDGPVVVLVHGIGDNSTTWLDVMAHLARRYTVIAPDLLGHGRSDKPRADYSVPAYANGMRDLLAVLGVEQATVIGHSLGGGVAMQFAYQFPHLVQRLVLVSTGGVTKEVNPFLRLASLPPAQEVLALLRLPGALPVIRAAGTVLQRLGTDLGHETPEVMRVLGALPDRGARSAFLRTLRAVVDWRGQVVTMLDRSYLTAGLPVQLVWGDRDPVIPLAHARLAQAAMPGARLEVFPGAGHFPYRDDLPRFLAVLEDFIATTEPNPYDQERWRTLLRTGAPDDAVVGSPATRRSMRALLAADVRSAT